MSSMLYARCNMPQSCVERALTVKSTWVRILADLCIQPKRRKSNAYDSPELCWLFSRLDALPLSGSEIWKDEDGHTPIVSTGIKGSVPRKCLRFQQGKWSTALAKLSMCLVFHSSTLSPTQSRCINKSHTALRTDSLHSKMWHKLMSDNTLSHVPRAVEVQHIDLSPALSRFSTFTHTHTISPCASR